ncbi:MAG: gamma-glutamyltransferase [Alphaproteobacteria bacterium]
MKKRAGFYQKNYLEPMKFNLLKLTLVFLLTSCVNQYKHNDEWVGDGYSGFENYQTVIGKKYMIATSEKIASEVGAEILKKGGNAVDSAIATQMVLNVIEPHSSGIGGGLFLLYYDNKTKKTIYFNGRETSPAKSYPELFLDKNGKPKNFYDVVMTPLSVATPGALHALKQAHKKYGKMKWSELFLPAIKIAKEGFKISPKIYANLKNIKHLSKADDLKIYFDQNNQPKKIGTIIYNFKLAETFEKIAKNGIKVFYEGQIANDIESTIQNSGEIKGLLTKNDLKNYRSKTGNLLCQKYRQKYKICSMPLPSSGGVTVLQTIGILENFDLTKYPINSSQYVHLVAEATKLAYADRNFYLGDIKNIDLNKFLNKKYLKQRADLINLNQANAQVKNGEIPELMPQEIYQANFEKPSTTHTSILDKYGNAVAMTSSIELQFGSTIMVDGFLLNNQMTDFAFLPKIDNRIVANRIEPNKQPLSSMSPTLVFDKNGKLILVLGSPNGPRIIQHVLKVLIACLDYKMDIQDAISLPNFIALNNKLELEKNSEIINLKKPLQNLGHFVKIIDITSAIQAIKIENNKIYGGADPRRQGVATGN